MREIPLISKKYPGLFVLVDDEDFDSLNIHRWYPSKQTNGFYAVTHLTIAGIRKTPRMHQLILGCGVDHKDGNGLNNCRNNLRLATQQQQRMNSNHTKKTRFKGVSLTRRGERLPWRCRIMISKKSIYLGQFGTEEEAAQVYDKKATELFGEFARTNFPINGVSINA